MVELATDIAGRGPVIVLLHGLTDSSRTWAPVVERLAGAHTVLTVDFPGHGRSPAVANYDVAALAGAVAETVRSIGIDAPDLVGHSLGAAVAVFAAPLVNARSLVTIDQALDLVSMKMQLQPVESLLRIPEECQALVGAILEKLGATLSHEQRVAVEAARRIDPAVVLGVFEPFLSTSVSALDERAEIAVSSLRCPHLSVFGSDPPRDYVEWMASVAPSAVMETWADAGHYLHLVDPVRFVDRLTAWWAV